MSLPLVLRMVPILVVAFAASGPAWGQQPPGVDLPSVRLEAHDGKTAFLLGEPIQLDLVFQNGTGVDFSLNDTVYGDLAEKVEITPAKGWFQCRRRVGMTTPP